MSVVESESNVLISNVFGDHGRARQDRESVLFVAKDLTSDPSDGCAKHSSNQPFIILCIPRSVRYAPWSQELK